MNRKILGVLILASFTTCANANLIRNPSFETIPGLNTGQGILPSEWIVMNSSPDTYSNDGSYGLSPSFSGNFSGVTAHDGDRWVAGWSNVSGGERFGQFLSSTLTGGQDYTFSSYLIQAKRSDLDHTGGYELYLTDFTGDISTGALLGSIGPTTNSDDWEFSSLTFTAPGNANSLDLLIFKPFGDSFGHAYPGLDSVDLSLASVPVPAAVWLMGSGLIGLMGFRKKKVLDSA